MNPLEHAMYAGGFEKPEDTQIHPEQRELRRLVKKFTQELESHAGNSKIPMKQLDLLEVFCHDQSRLTQQCRNLGGHANRHGYREGDLMTEEGRKTLFIRVIGQKPRHLWLSPVCGPWSAWSALNATRSLQHYDQYQEERTHLLNHVALCIVLYRHQVAHERHFHLEQPLRSLMLKIGMLSELYEHAQAAEFDMCEVGDLKDPESGLK